MAIGFDLGETWGVSPRDTMMIITELDPRLEGLVFHYAMHQMCVCMNTLLAFVFLYISVIVKHFLVFHPKTFLIN